MNRFTSVCITFSWQFSCPQKSMFKLLSYQLKLWYCGSLDLNQLHPGSHIMCQCSSSAPCKLVLHIFLYISVRCLITPQKCLGSLLINLTYCIFNDLKMSVSATGEGVLQRVCHHVKLPSVDCFDFPKLFFQSHSLRLLIASSFNIVIVQDYTRT